MTTDEAVLAEIKKAVDLQNQIDALRAPQMAALQHAAMILSTMDPVGGKPQVTRYSQRDPLWASERLGTSATTIGGYGCLMSSAASMLTDADYPLTPALLNAWLIQNGGYASGNHFVFAAIDKLGAVKYDYAIECATKPAPIAQLDQEIAAGKFVIVKVDFTPGTIAIDEHWVRYIGNGEMMDPWHGDIAPIVPRYRGKNAAEAILRCLVYRKIQSV